MRLRRRWDDGPRTDIIMLIIINIALWAILLLGVSGCTWVGGEDNESTHQPFIQACLLFARCDATAQDRAATAEDSEVEVGQSGTQESDANLSGDDTATVPVQGGAVAIPGTQ